MVDVAPDIFDHVREVQAVVVERLFPGQVLEFDLDLCLGVWAFSVVAPSQCTGPRRPDPPWTVRARPCAFRHMNTIAGSTDELFDFAIVLAGTGQPMGGRNHKPMDDDAQATGTR